MGDGEQRLGIPKQREETKNPGVWKEHYARMVAYARRLVGDNDAEDIANTALFDACGDSKRERPPIESDEIRGLLRHLVRLRARELWRNQRRRLARTSPQQDLDMQTAVFVLDKRTEFVLDRFALARAMSDLDELDRRLVWEHYVDDFTAPELAHKYGMNESTVRSRIARALPKLAKVLDGEQRKGRTRSRSWFFVGLGFSRAWMDRVAAKLRSWFGEVVEFGQAMVPSVASVVILALIPSDAAEARELTETWPPNGDELVAPSWDGLRGPWVSINMIQARMDEARPETNPVMKKVAARIVARRPVLKRQDEPIPPNEPVVSAKPPAPMAISEANRCDNAFSQALAHWQIAERAECLAILDQHRRGPNACLETPEWSNLRRYCQSAPAKLRK